MEDPPRISEPLISIFVSYFESVVGHNFTYVMSKGKRKKENGNLRLRFSGGVLHEGGSLNGWKLPTVWGPSTTPDRRLIIDLLYRIRKKSDRTTLMHSGKVKKSDRTTLRHSGKVKKSARGISACRV
jgi:hypothetical protein